MKRTCAHFNIIWLKDNAALYHALKSKNPVLPIFIFDKKILSQLENKADRRASSLYITAAGKKLKSEVAPYIEERFKEITVNIPDNDIEVYEQVLKKLEANLDQLLVKQKP